MFFALSAAGVAGLGSMVFWLLNQADARGRKLAHRQRYGERIEWP